MKSKDEILLKANECINCKNPLCINGCPMETDIPSFISKVKEQKFEEAYYILKDNNIMSNICSIVCPSEQQCMGKCIKGIKSESVLINELEDCVNTWAEENDTRYEIKCEKRNNVKIAVIGGGPSGLSCATQLVKKGFDVTIFEREAELRWSIKVWHTRF